MEPSRLRCVLAVPNGPQKRVGHTGVIIGRQQDCDILATDPAVSRRHALVRMTATGAEVVPLGRAPIEVNKKSIDKACALADGDVIAMPGLSLAVSLTTARIAADAPATFRLERAGASFAIACSPFVIGGGDTDDLIVKRWPAAALRFHVAQRELFLEVATGKAVKNGVDIAASADALEPVADGDVVVYRKDEFRVRRVAHGARDATTMVAGLGNLPTRVAVELLPRGGRVVFAVGDGERAVYLADRQLDLVIALLRANGEVVDDDAVRAIVWPRNPSVSRPEINMLISRCRRTFVEAGLAGPRLLVRAPGGGGTKLALAANATVVME